MVGPGGLAVPEGTGRRGAPARLSIKFNVDGFNDQMGTTGFTTGRVVGSIGPYAAGEPKYFVAGRALPSTGNPSFNTAYAQLDGDVLTLDLGNSLPTGSSAGPLADTGPLSLALLPAGGAPVPIGPIDYTSPDWYPLSAGIVSFRLTPDQVKLAATAPLGVVPPGGGAAQAFLAEAATGLWLRADSYVFRLDPGETAHTTFYATTFGRRAGGLEVVLAYDATIMQGQTTQGPIAGPSVVGQPMSALTFPDSVTTGPDGTAELTLEAGDPGDPRDYIDGQVYGVTYGPADNPPRPGSVTNSSLILGASSTPASRSPTYRPGSMSSRSSRSTPTSTPSCGRSSTCPTSRASLRSEKRSSGSSPSP